MQNEGARQTINKKPFKILKKQELSKIENEWAKLQRARLNGNRK